MIGFAPLDDDPPPPRRPPRVQTKPRNRLLPVKEGTECNYVVLFFVVGVVLLAISDSRVR